MSLNENLLKSHSEDFLKKLKLKLGLLFPFIAHGDGVSMDVDADRL